MSRARVFRAKPGELQSMRIQAADRNKESHSPGWPHFDRKGNCLCTGSCCIKGGCVCRDCTHRSHQ